jgi:hypothetical protein
MTTLEMRGQINDEGQIELDQPLALRAGERVRVLVEFLDETWQAKTSERHAEAATLPEVLRVAFEHKSYLEGVRWFETHASRLSGETILSIKALASPVALEEGYSTIYFIAGAADAFCELT